jgi:hypothetical protein
MPVQGSSISVHFARSAVNAARCMGLDEKLFLHEGGLNRRLLEKPHLRITAAQFSQLMLALWRLGDDEFMGLTPHRCRSGVFALMARQIISCRQLGSVYSTLARFYNLINDSIRLEMLLTGHSADFVMQLAEPSKDANHLLRELFMLLWHRFASWLVGQRIPLREVHFDYPEPTHHAEYRLMYPCLVRFGMPDCRLVMDEGCLAMPVVQTAATLRTH